MEPVSPLSVRYLPVNAAYGVFYGSTLIRVKDEPTLFERRIDALEGIQRKHLTRPKGEQ